MVSDFPESLTGSREGELRRRQASKADVTLLMRRTGAAASRTHATLVDAGEGEALRVRIAGPPRKKVLLERFVLLALSDGLLPPCWGLIWRG